MYKKTTLNKIIRYEIMNLLGEFPIVVAGESETAFMGWSRNKHMRILFQKQRCKKSTGHGSQIILLYARSKRLGSNFSFV